MRSRSSSCTCVRWRLLRVTLPRWRPCGGLYPERSDPCPLPRAAFAEAPVPFAGGRGNRENGVGRRPRSSPRLRGCVCLSPDSPTPFLLGFASQISPRQRALDTFSFGGGKAFPKTKHAIGGH
jgi:hypothetical protein